VVLQRGFLEADNCIWSLALRPRWLDPGSSAITFKLCDWLWAQASPGTRPQRRSYHSQYVEAVSSSLPTLTNTVCPLLLFYCFRSLPLEPIEAHCVLA